MQLLNDAAVSHQSCEGGRLSSQETQVFLKMHHRSEQRGIARQTSRDKSPTGCCEDCLCLSKGTNLCRQQLRLILWLPSRGSRKFTTADAANT